MTLSRNLVVKYLSKIELKGSMVDLGGSSKSNMYKYLKSKPDSITIVNINKDYGCDIVADITKKIPLEDKQFNNVLCLAVLEHIFEYDNVVKESYRLLNDNGIAYFSVPFIYKVHGSPHDYFRYTKSALERIFKNNGFSYIEVTPLGYGPFIAGYSLVEQLFPRPINLVLKYISILFDKIISKYTKTYNKDTYPILYFIKAIK